MRRENCSATAIARCLSASEGIGWPLLDSVKGASVTCDVRYSSTPATATESTVTTMIASAQRPRVRPVVALVKRSHHRLQQQRLPRVLPVQLGRTTVVDDVGPRRLVGPGRLARAQIVRGNRGAGAGAVVGASAGSVLRAAGVGLGSRLRTMCGHVHRLVRSVER